MKLLLTILFWIIVAVFAGFLVAWLVALIKKKEPTTIYKLNIGIAACSLCASAINLIVKNIA